MNVRDMWMDETTVDNYRVVMTRKYKNEMKTIKLGRDNNSHVK